MELKRRIKELREEYERFYGVLAWQPSDEEKELGFLARACFDESIPSKKVNDGTSENITLYFILLASLMKENDPRANFMNYYETLEALKKLKKFFAG